MPTFIVAVAVVFALGGIGHLASKRTGYKILEPLSPAGRRGYRVLACLAMAISSALLFALYLAYRVSVELGNFYITTDWEGYGVFVFLLWLCLSGLICFLATHFIMGGYVSSHPSNKRGETVMQKASLAAARAVHKASKGNPLIPLWGFVIISLPCLIGIGLMQARYVRPTEQGLAHLGFFDVYEDVLPWGRIAELSVVRVKDPDAGPYVRWNLSWTDTEGNEVILLENRNIWRLIPHTISATIAHHEARGIVVNDPRPAGDKFFTSKEPHNF
jgi:hypothetical protein